MQNTLSSQEKLDRLRELGFEPKFHCSVRETDIEKWKISLSVPKLYIRDAGGLFYYMDSGEGASPAEAVERLWSILVSVAAPEWLGTEQSNAKYDFRLTADGQKIPRESL